MRRTALLQSVARILGESHEVREAAYAWIRHRWITPFAAVVMGAIVFLAPLAGVDDWSTRIAMGLAGVALAVMATTDYRVVARTDQGISLFKASRFRQAAKELIGTIEDADVMEPVAGSLIATDWLVRDEKLTVPRSSQQAMERMARSRAS